MKTRPTITRTLIQSISVFAFATVVIMLCSCSGTGGKKTAGVVDSTKGLKDFYKKYFLVGVGVGPYNLEGEQA
jgi:hypothetical protein